MAKPCEGCGSIIHFGPDPTRPKKWLAYNEDNSRHYCGTPKKESTAVPTEGDYVTLSQRELMHLREQITMIHMQLSEIRAVLKAMNEEPKEQRTQVSPSITKSDSIEDQINAIDFDNMFSESNPS